MTELTGKVVVITGGSSGIGLAIIKHLLKTDVKVGLFFFCIWISDFTSYLLNCILVCSNV